MPPPAQDRNPTPWRAVFNDDASTYFFAHESPCLRLNFFVAVTGLESDDGDESHVMKLDTTAAIGSAARVVRRRVPREQLECRRCVA